MSPAPEAVAGQVLELTVERQVAEGWGLARHEGRIVFVAGAIPGERVRARLTQVRSRLAYAEGIEVLAASVHRVPDRRVDWGAAGIGGVDFAHVGLGWSRRLKAEAAAEQLARLGGISVADLPVLPAPHEAAEVSADPSADASTAGTRWRTRVQLAVDADGTPGMRAAGSHTVIPVETLPLAVPALDALGIHHLRLPGVERIELTAATASGAVVLTTPAGQELDADAAAAVAARLETADGQWSLVHRTAEPIAPSSGRGRGNRAGGRRSGGSRGRGRAGGGRGGAGGRAGRGGAGDRAGRQQSSRQQAGLRNRGARTRLDVLSGTGTVTQRVPLSTLDGSAGERTFRLQADGFWQVHVDAAAVLADAVVAAAAGAGRVLDLYCGAGLLTCAVGAGLHVPVTGLEGSAEAIEAARANGADLNADFAVARIDRLESLPAADTIILDPPRAGAGPSVTSLLTASGAERIIYVSCDAGTFARDARALLDQGFALESCTGHDLFPLTAHTEFVSVFTR